MAGWPIPNPTAEQKPSVLLVDDEPANLLALRAILDDLGHELVEARSGEEALRLLHEREFAVVLLDVQMPGVSGFETAKLMRQVSRHGFVPIIFLSAFNHAEFSPAQAYTLGAVDYLTKPLEPVVLRAKVTGFVELYVDKKRGERQTQQLRLLIEGTPDYAIFMLDPTGKVVTWNLGAQRINGYLPEEIIGRDLSIFYTEEAQARQWPQHELKVAAATGRFEDESWRVRKDGTPFWCNVIITALRDSAGNLIGFSKITRDLSERKKADEALRQVGIELEKRVQERTAELARANEALKEANRQKDDFLAMLAHELRNPLAPVRNALQIMKVPGLGPEAILRARAMMERQIRHLVRLVDDLLDVSRIMRGKIELRKERIELSEVFAAAVETAQPTVDAHAQELIVSLPPEPIHLYADLVRLGQVVSNLLVNAAKYTQKAGRIWLTAERKNNEVVIQVRDTGIGIDSELLPRIFDLFVQSDRSLARSQGGLGIGLTLVKRLTEMHGGAVSVTSAGPGQGSEFFVRLPALPATAAAKPSRDQQLSRAGVSRRVLVVDDNVDAADSAAMLLRLVGHQVEIAHNGAAALDLAARFRPDVILLDIGLPGMSGYDVARALRARPEHQNTIVAAITGYGQEDDRKRSREAGFDCHLTKPLAPAELTAFCGGAGNPEGR
jgi:PAS domain S-box-containing protein